MGILINKLEREHYNRVCQIGVDCSLIVVHPKTYKDLIREVQESFGIQINFNKYSLEYRGIKVIRSLDVLEGYFLVI